MIKQIEKFGFHEKSTKSNTAAALAASIVTTDAQAYLWGDYSNGQKSKSILSRK